jgi:hypothetical protein
VFAPIALLCHAEAEGGAADAHALAACQDGSLHCVDARGGRLVWRRPAAPGAAPGGRPGLALEARLGPAAPPPQAGGAAAPVRAPHAVAGRATAAERGPGGAEAAQPGRETRRSEPPRLGQQDPSRDLGPAAPSARHLVLCAAGGAVAVMQRPGVPTRRAQGAVAGCTPARAGEAALPGSGALAGGLGGAPRAAACGAEPGASTACGKGSLAPDPSDPAWHDCILPRTVAGAQLPAEAFSAPVAFDGRVVLGCRDDHLYCLTWRPLGDD